MDRRIAAAVRECEVAGLAPQVHGPWDGLPDGARLCSHSGLFKEGDLFACVKGASYDGHRFIEEAVARGACGLLLSSDCLPPHENWIRVSDPRAAMGFFAAELAGRPLERMEAYAVTGSNGKTTTSCLIRHLIERCSGRPCGLVGTLVYHDGLQGVDADRTTPESSALQDLFSRMAANGCRAVVMETSSHGLVQGRLNGCRYDGGVFTNLSPEHLDFHGTMEDYFAAKGRLAQVYLKDQAPLSVPGFGSWGPAMARLARRPVTWGLECDGAFDLTARAVELSAAGSRFELLWRGRDLGAFALPLVGRFNLENALAALALLLEKGYEPDGLRRALSDAPAVPGRMNSFSLSNGVTVVIDYAHTAKALELVLAALRPLARRLTAVFGHGGGRYAEARPALGAAASRYCDRVIITSDNNRFEAPEAIGAMIRQGLSGSLEFLEEYDRGKALALALDGAKAGDVIALTGKGAEKYLESGGVKTPYNDEETLRRLAAEKGVTIR